MTHQPTGLGVNLTLLDFITLLQQSVRDRGDGRGARWPTVFNEDILQDVSTNFTMGMVLSHHT